MSFTGIVYPGALGTETSLMDHRSHITSLVPLQTSGTQFNY